jgi:predicted metal-dependent hydrolase
MDFHIEKIIRSKRKSFCIEIDEAGKILLRIPIKASDETIKEFIKKHSKWIEKKLNEIENRKIKYQPKNFVDGEKFLYLGKFYDLKIIEDQKFPLIFEDGFYLSNNYISNAYKIFKNFYKKMAKEIINERIKFYVNKYGFKYNKIKITSANKRWGSCTGKGNLNFSYRLIMAPLKVVDYVVVHELVHLIDKTHKKSFYNKVEKILPDYKERKDWLNKNGYLLKI